MIKQKKYSDLVKKILFTAIVLLFFYIGQGVPVPGYHLSFRVPGNDFSLERMLSLTTGGLFSSPTLLSLGMGPYMTISILLSVGLFANRELASQISQEQRGRIEVIGILFMSILQSIPLAFNLKGEVTSQMNFLTPLSVFLFTVLCFVSGALLISWLASLNTIYGVGGPFILILPGIMKGITGSLAANYTTVLSHIDRLIIFVIITVIFVWISVSIYTAEYRFDIQRIGIDRRSKDAYIAFRLLIAGSMPLMFATTMMYFPAYIMQLFHEKNEFILSLFSINKVSGILVYGIILYALGVLFSFVNIMPEQVTKDLKESGDYIVGIVPGHETRVYITKRIWFITAIGSLFLPIIVTVPLLVGLMTHHQSISNMSNYFAMFFVLVVIFDTVQQDVRFLLYKNNYSLFDNKRRRWE